MNPLQVEMSGLEEVCKGKDEVLAAKEQEIAAKERTLSDERQRVSSLTEECATLKARLEGKTEEIERYNYSEEEHYVTYLCRVTEGGSSRVVEGKVQTTRENVRGWMEGKKERRNETIGQMFPEHKEPGRGKVSL